MNCKGVIHELSNFIDGDLDVVMRQELERHLEHCEDCAMILNQAKKTIEIFCDSKPVELPSEVKLRLHDALRRKFGQRST